MDEFCKVGHLFYGLKILGEKSIEVGEQLYEAELREQLIQEQLKQFEYERASKPPLLLSEGR